MVLNILREYINIFSIVHCIHQLRSSVTLLIRDDSLLKLLLTPSFLAVKAENVTVCVCVCDRWISLPSSEDKRSKGFDGRPDKEIEMTMLVMT